jgi:hypothetical protein
MRPIPHTENTPLVRTDFSDDQAWQDVVRIVSTPGDMNDVPSCTVIDDRDYAGATARQLRELADQDEAYLYVADQITHTSRERPLLLLDLDDECADEDPDDDRLLEFRCAAHALGMVDANLQVVNMDFSEFADSAADDEEGIFHGYSPQASS